MTIPDDFSGWLFWITISDNYSGCLFQMTVPDDCSRWLFRMSILDDCSRWRFRMNVRDSTTDSYFSDRFVFPRPVPISTNHSADWSHDWFVFERRLSTAELWSRSPPDTFVSNSSLEMFPWFRFCRLCIRATVYVNIT